MDVIYERLSQIGGLQVIKGSLRQHRVTIPTPSAIVVPIEIKTEREGNQYVVVTERYEIVCLVSSRQTNPYSDLMNLMVDVAGSLCLWLPDAWHPNITVKGVEVSSLRFDTHPEADELGLVAGSVEVTVSYYSV